jgi:hypothetical protein
VGPLENNYETISISFATGWIISGTDHYLSNFDATRLMRTGLQLQLSMSSLPLCFKSYTGQLVQGVKKSRPHIILHRDDARYRRLGSHQEREDYLLLLQYRAPYEGVKPFYRSDERRKSSPSSNDNRPREDSITDFSIKQRSRITAISYDVDNHIERVKLVEPNTPDKKANVENDSSPQIKTSMILAHFTDYTGMVKNQGPSPWMYGYFQAISILSPLLRVGSTLQLSGYWKRLAAFAMGDPGYRFLPYSQGYGITHSNPTLVRRKYRYGFFDVDTIEKLPSLPGWRGSWSFDVSFNDLLYDFASLDWS